MMHALPLLALILGAQGACKVRCGPGDVAGQVLFDPVTQLVQPRDNSCRFHAFPFPDAAECLKGSWLVFFGGSTTQIVALRTAGFLQSRGLDSSFLQPNKSATLRGLRNIDVIYTDGAAAHVAYANIAGTSNMTSEKQTEQVNAFLRNANANFLSRRAGKTGSRVDMRVTLIQDRYGLAAEGLARNLHRFTRELDGLTRVFFVIGPIGVWYDTCTPKALQVWSCNVPKLRGKELPEILDAYRKMWVSTLIALARARKAGVLSGAIVVPHRRLFQNQYDKAVVEAGSRLLPGPGGSVKELLPVMQGQNFEEWYQSPLAWSLNPQPYNEEFEGHPSGVVAHWSLMFILTAICRHDPGGCPVNPVFSRQCYADYIYGAPGRPRTPWNGNEGGWTSSLLVKGCRSEGVEAAVARPGYRLGSAVGLGVPASGSTTSAVARPPRGAAERDAASGEPSAASTSSSPRLWLLALGSAGVVAAILWREQKRPSCGIVVDASDKAAAKQDTGLDEGPRLGAQAAPRTTRIESLVFSRYIASLHVVAGHLYARGFRMSTLSVLQPALSWGFSWVPFFFMLSGFVLAYAKAGRVSPYLEQSEQQRLLAKTLESPLLFAYKRSINVFPLYLLGLVGSAGLSWLLRAPLAAASNPAAVLSQALLLQAWFPCPSTWLRGMPSIEHTLQAHCWFISCEAAYWFLFPALLRRLVSFSLPGLLWLAMLLPAAMLMLLLWLLPALLGLPTDWEHHTNGSASAYIAVLKFFPLCYWHLFVVGMAGACVFRYYWHDRTNHSGVSASSAGTPPAALLAVLLPRPPLKRVCYPLIDHGALIGYLALSAVLFSPVPALQAESGRTMLRLCFRLGLLAPLHGLILLGLAAGTDPLARAFTSQPLQTLGNWSYAQFIFQFIAFRLFFDVLLPGADPLHWAAKVGFFLFLTALAALGYTLVQAPLRTERRYNVFLSAAGAGVLLWVALLISQSFERAAPEASRSTPAFVALEMGCYDARLNFTFDSDPASEHGSAVINPSALRMGPGKLLLVARRHRLEEVRTASAVEYIYHSSLVVTTMDDAWQQSAPWKELRPRLPVVLGRTERALLSVPAPRPAPRPSLPPRGWVPCHKPGSFFAANNTRVTVRTTGPQDPRLFLHDGRFAMLGFFSMNPVLSSKARAHADVCAGDVHGQVYLAQVRFAVEPAAAPRHVPGMAHKRDADSLPTLAANLSAVPTAVRALILGPVYYLPLDTLPDRLYAVTDPLDARLGPHPPAAFKAKHKSRPTGSKGLVEKNWLFFEHAGRTLMVYRVYPHVVVALPKQHGGSTKEEFKIYRGDASLLGDIVREYGAIDDGLIAHGGAAPVPFRTRQGRRLFLASFHTLPLYRHYLYLFEPTRFDIVAVSAPLPLTEHPSAPGRTFASSLLPSGDGGYAVLYGCADKESRVLVLTNASMAALFAHADL